MPLNGGDVLTVNLTATPTNTAGKTPGQKACLAVRNRGWQNARLVKSLVLKAATICRIHPQLFK